MRRGLSDGCDTPDRSCGKIVDSDRPCRLGERELRAAYGRGGLRQLRSPLSDGSHYDGSVRSRYGGFSENPRCERRAVHRLRRVRKPLPGASVQCDLYRRTRKSQNDLRLRTHGKKDKKRENRPARISEKTRRGSGRFGGCAVRLPSEAQSGVGRPLGARRGSDR